MSGANVQTRIKSSFPTENRVQGFSSSPTLQIAEYMYPYHSLGGVVSRYNGPRSSIMWEQTIHVAQQSNATDYASAIIIGLFTLYDCKDPRLPGT